MPLLTKALIQSGILLTKSTNPAKVFLFLKKANLVTVRLHVWRNNTRTKLQQSLQSTELCIPLHHIPGIYHTSKNYVQTYFNNESGV